MTRASRRPDRRPRTPGFTVKIQQGGNQVRDGAQGTGIWAKRAYNNLLGRNLRRAIDQNNSNDPAVMTCSSSREAPFVITHRFTWSGQPVQREIYTNITLSDSRYVPDTDPELEKQLEVARSLGKLHLCCHPLSSLYQAQEPDITPEPTSVGTPSVATLTVNCEDTIIMPSGINPLPPANPRPGKAAKTTQVTDPAQQFLENEWVAENAYRRVPPRTIYLAVDSNLRLILAVFPEGLEMAYPSSGNVVADRIYDNIMAYTAAQPPPAADDVRHKLSGPWSKLNPHLKVCGVYHWGSWTELGKSQGTILTRDTLLSPAYCHRARSDLLRSMGELTRAVDFVFKVLDHSLRHEYRDVFQGLNPSVKISTTEEEVFTLRAVIINLLTEDHVDNGDWRAGLSFLAPLGDFTGADLCLPALKIRVPLPSGSIGSIRGREFRHFITSWIGKGRVSVVHTTHETARREVFGRIGKDGVGSG